MCRARYRLPRNVSVDRSLCADVIEMRLQLMAVRLEFFAGRLEGAAAGRILMAEGASFACLLRVDRRGVGDVGQSQRHRAGDQYCGRAAADKNEGLLCMHLHIRLLHW